MYPIHKEERENYRGISLSVAAYKIFFNILLRMLNEFD